MNIYKKLSFVVLTIIICGCGHPSGWLLAPFSTNKHSLWRKGDILFEGTHNLITGKRTYGRLYVGSPKAYAKNLPPIYIEWPHGEKILLSSVTGAMLIDTDHKDNIIEDRGSASVPQEGDRAFWPKNARFFDIIRPRESPDSFSTWLYSFTVIENKVVGFIAPVKGPGFWNESQTKHYKFPLSEEEVVELFGEPDEIVEYVPMC